MEDKMTDELERDKLEVPEEASVNPNAFPVDTGSEPTPTGEESETVDHVEVPDDACSLDPDVDESELIEIADASPSPYEDEDATQEYTEGFGGPGDAPRTPREAIADARHKANSSYDDGAGMCLMNVRTYYGVGSLYLDAKMAWEEADTKHRVKASETPRGTPVFWKGGSSGHGHIALAVGKGLCYSTDWASDGSIGLARIEDISSHWGQEFLGYTREVNEVIVWTPNEQDKPDVHPTYPNIKKAIQSLKKAATNAKRQKHMKRYHALLHQVAALRKFMAEHN